MGSARGGEYYISKPRWSSGKIYVPGDPSLGLKEDILSLEIVYFCIFGGATKLRGARSAPFGMVIRPIRRVRAVHGRARADKTH